MCASLILELCVSELEKERRMTRISPWRKSSNLKADSIFYEHGRNCAFARGYTISNSPKRNPIPTRSRQHLIYKRANPIAFQPAASGSSRSQSDRHNGLSTHIRRPEDRKTVKFAGAYQSTNSVTALRANSRVMCINSGCEKVRKIKAISNCPAT